MIIRKVFLAIILLTVGYIMVFAQEKTEKIPVEPTTESPSKEIVVFSFYDTQLELVCYSANSGIFCISKYGLGDHGRAFITDRVEKYKEEKFGKDSILIPRIVPLEK
jgi:hypothetical protein